jgi:predicted dehydrogenase
MCHLLLNSKDLLPMTRIGIVGLGFMGRIHYLASQALEGGRVTAICSRDAAKRAGDWSATRGNFGPPPGHVDLSGVTAYERFEDMLADPALDLIDICSVTDTHAAMAIQALKAGKHVLVEKAIALSPAEADAMLTAARQGGKLLMVAHVLPFFAEFAYAARIIRAGDFGKVVAAHLNRVIARPDWSAEISDAAKTGGPAVDLHIHDTHFIALTCGVPKRVRASGVIHRGSVDYVSTQYDYGPGGPAVTCTSGAVAMPGRPFVHGFEIYLERATLSYSSAGMPLTLFKVDGGQDVVALPGNGDPVSAFTAELQDAVNAVKSDTKSQLLDAQIARDALVMSLKECESAQTGEAIAI